VQSVLITPVARRDVSPSQQYVGRVQAINTVKLQARVEGFLEQRKFTEGAAVKKGELLFVIEQAQYQAAVEQSQASVEQRKATLKNDQLNLQRQKTLVGRGDVAVSTLDAATATEAASAALVKDSEAALKISQLNLSYTKIHSPIDGRISTASVDVGNLVSPSTGTLATVTSIDPVYVTLNPSATRILEQRQRGLIKGNQITLVPRLKLSNGSMYSRPGKFNYVNTSVQEGTDTIELRAEFSNPDALLTPGEYLTVIVEPEKADKSLVVPQQSVQLDKTGHFVLVVANGEKVERKNIAVAGMNGADWIVTKGLKEGERVIVSGLQKVKPGDTVRVAKSGS
jgi:membrane fusion protein (multidrug efflux system)